MTPLVVDADDRYVAGRVSWGCHGDDATILAQRPAALKRAEWSAVQLERPELHPRGHRLAEQALHHARAEGPRERELVVVNENRPG